MKNEEMKKEVIKKEVIKKEAMKEETKKDDREDGRGENNGVRGQRCQEGVYISSCSG